MAVATPFSDFLASLSDPATLERYQLDPVNLIRLHGLTKAQEAALRSGDRGAIRMEAVRELEAAGLAPVVSDKIPQRPGHVIEVGMILPNTTTQNHETATNVFLLHSIDTTTTNHDTATNVSERPGARPSTPRNDLRELSTRLTRMSPGHQDSRQSAGRRDV